MTLTGSLDGLVGDSIDGATGLLGGHTGQLIIFMGSIVIIGIVIAAFFYFTRWAKHRG